MDHGLAEERAGSESGASKALLASVIIMGVLIVLGLVVLVGTIVHRATHSQKASVFVAADSAQTRIALPLGGEEHVESVVPRSDGTLAVTLQSGDGARILLWSPEGGRIVGELDLGKPAQP
ncbi:hypothetical protein [Gluconobacter wancherniae]|uniref:Uncharacterized protein n=1 Tax=Gluconobacter wancherniae NBRC 103581 TaxID=656744 RepID=A0A511B0Q3_9PROT|nr:hypothetical protein [Gluconobacter wancherniae]MBF0854133.1 hypothetical protein [Gluconobacter wancherniae]GBR65346.1 hypothetical protein AA103581_1780 [Gluconobacter wancherniae NBRC 103581]GEK94039.1 hypothetical protein GWA01_18090 [Gluconobacter wancherniae NBRC 103581]